MHRSLVLVALGLVLGCACSPSSSSSASTAGLTPTPAAARTTAGDAETPERPPGWLVAPTMARDADGTVTLAAVGDIMLDRLPAQRLMVDGPSSIFAAVREALAADLTVGNLESAVSERGDPAQKGYTFRAPPLAAEALALAGFDVLSQANNHALDWGPEALADTRALLARQAVGIVGSGANDAEAHQPVVFTRAGRRIAFLAYVDVPADGSFSRETWDATPTRPGVAWLETSVMTRDIAATREAADVVIVLLHFGFEGSSEPSPAQRAQARAAIDAGAAVVLGSHPHVLQPVEEYGGGLIVYSLGNSVFDGFDGVANETAIFRATLSAEGVDTWSLLPARIDGWGLPHLVD